MPRPSDRTLGILLSLFGNTLISLSLTLQKLAHTSPNPSSNSPHPPSSPPSPPTQRSDYLTNPKWHLGILLMALGELFNFIALSYAPAALITPLGSWSVVVAALLACWILEEIVWGWEWVGMGVCVIGGVLMASGAPDDDGVIVNKGVVGVVGVVVGVGVGILVMVGRLEGGGFGKRFLGVYVGVSSLLGAVSVVCAKYLSMFLREFLGELGDGDGGWVFKKLLERKELKVLGVPLVVTGLLMGTVLTQLYYLNLAMMHFGNAKVVSVYYVLFTFCAIVGSSVVYGELDRFGGRNWLFVVGVLATMGGVVLVSRREIGKNVGGEKGALRRDMLENSEEYELVNADEESMM